MKGKSGERTRRKQKVAVDRVDDWLREQPLQWSTVIAVRAALRALPLGVNTRGDRALSTFRAAAIAQFSAKHPNRAIDSSYVRLAMAAYGCADQEKNSGLLAVAIAAKTAAEVALTRSKPADDRILLGAPYLSASAAIGAATHAANDAQEFLNALSLDMNCLSDGLVTFGKLVETPLWYEKLPDSIANEWDFLVRELRSDGDNWSVWIKWYNDILFGQRSTELEDAAFTDIPGHLPWDEGSEAVIPKSDGELGALRPDPAAVEGISSPITINRKPDGRIGVEPGPFSLPTVPEFFKAR